MTSDRLKLVIAGGGTGGHISPALATVSALRGRCQLDVAWIGGTWGVERESAQRAQIRFIPIQAGKLRRYLSWQTPVDAVRIPIGVAQAYGALKRIQPDIVFSTGGYVAVPTALAASRLGIPIVTHEQTAQLGLATRIIARYADVLALSFPVPLDGNHVGNARVIVTGNPVRPTIFGGDAARGAARFGLTTDLPTIYVTGGARGSSPINERIEKALPLLLPFVQIIHSTGPADANGDYPRLVEVKKHLSEEQRGRYIVVETLADELADVYALAALVVGRSGAGTVAELAALGKPSILIPLPGTGGDEATKNARVLADADAAILIPQPEATPELIASHILALRNDPDRLQRMGNAAHRLAPIDAARELAEEILSVARSQPAASNA
jgi:UDP-N-acetylglucosamine--N-acetylmuramyl-(pentapeptide) pyrophosphoryl-undecaprenol N-acetylglucosamine transferase